MCVFEKYMLLTNLDRTRDTFQFFRREWFCWKERRILFSWSSIVTDLHGLVAHQQCQFVFFLFEGLSAAYHANVLVFLMGHNPKCLQRVLIPPPSPVLANIQSILAYDVPDTEDVGPGGRPTHQIPVQCWASVAANYWFNRKTNLSPGLLYTLHKHVAFNQYCFNVDSQSSMLDSHQNSIGWLYRLFWLLHYAGDL